MAVAQGYICKDYRTDVCEEEEMKLVNQYTRRTMSAEEVYLFTVVLCDNEIDRDYERFTRQALAKLSHLFVGKTGIFNHSMKSENQTARIFSCRVEQVPGRTTGAGEPYERLIARAYLPKTEKNRDLIEDLDSGIKKEVSVGCAVGRVTCSICGADLRAGGCAHQKGVYYECLQCHAVLSDPTDAYEWSFVAVPAQREAGVVKAYLPKMRKEECKIQEIIKQLQAGGEVVLSQEQSYLLQNAWQELEELARDGRAYREDLRKEVVRMSAISQPELSIGVMEALTQKMTLEELKQFRKAYAAKAQDLTTPSPQLAPEAKGISHKDNTPYFI